MWPSVNTFLKRETKALARLADLLRRVVSVRPEEREN